MSSVIQWIIVGIVIGVAVAYLFTKLKSKSSDCDNCPLGNTCTKRSRRR